MHEAYSLALVRKGSFGYSTEGRTHDLVAGSVLIGRPGQEYVCTHEHVVGDVCLSFEFAPEVLEGIGGRASFEVWRRGALPPLERIMVLGVVPDCAPEEIALELAARVVEASGASIAVGEKPPAYADRKRAIRAAELIESTYAEPLDLEHVARAVNLSPFHFLRIFSRVLGVTPHQYLKRTRLAAAAKLLAGGDRSIARIAFDVGFGDVSGFVRAFHRAAGVSPRAFRSKILQERSAAKS